jgi:hypothetical protein
MKKLLFILLAMFFAALAPAAEAAILVDSYTAATAAKTATAAGTAPFFSICGGARTLRVLQVIVGGTVATAAVNADVILTKTSTATSGGTATALTKTPQDSNSTASVASLANFYTVLATAGTAIGRAGSQTAFLSVAPAAHAPVTFDWTLTPDKAPVLRGAAQCLEASFGTTTTNAPTLTVQVLYTEEQ